MEDARINTPRLEYAQRPPWHRRRTARRIVFALCIALLVGGLTLWLPPAWRRTQLLYWQRQCLEHQPQEGRVVWEQSGSTVAQTNSVEAWDKFEALYEPPGSKHQAAVYVGELQTPSGSRRLVHVFFTLGLMQSNLVWADALEPGTFWKDARRVGANPDPVGVLGDLPGRLRIFEGQADRRVPSHFTFDYELNGMRHTMDGWLHEDGTVAMAERTERGQTISIVPGATSRPGEMGVP